MIFRNMLTYSTIVFLLFLSNAPAFGESHPEYFGLTNPSEFSLKIDDNSFSIPYEVNAKIIAMDIDVQSSSLLVGLKDTQDSLFKIDLQHELISDSNNDYTVLVDGVEVDYDLVTDSDSSTFTIFVPEFTEEVEIIGTRVIPEFHFGIFAGLAALVFTVLILSKSKMSLFKW